MNRSKTNKDINKPHLFACQTAPLNLKSFKKRDESSILPLAGHKLSFSVPQLDPTHLRKSETLRNI